ncbi:nuclear factor, interleukin 3 regulated, member 3 [Lampris incognitus]|uniref:nuclear factor, interleukin 3 regulated, member 3 n=1 Tax=Lampris incognitus TaxID=2546036 RepID=UPI0024B58930|nr:nuclear factor, interleukin 3 regulated, member 3 [Lampris incognitus]
MGSILHDLSTPPLLSVESTESHPRPTSFTEEAVSIPTSTSHLARTLLGHTSALKPQESLANTNTNDTAGSGCDDNGIRRKREFIPDERKDEGYWDKRRKNNEAAKRSREKRRANDIVQEARVLGLLEENARLRAELLALKFRFGLVKDPSHVSILPLSVPSYTQLVTPTQRHYPSLSSSYQSTPSANSTHHSTHFPPQQSAMYGLKDAGVPAGHSKGNITEESGISTPSSSNVSSPVFFNDGLNENGWPSPKYRVEGQQGYEPNLCSPEVTQAQYVSKQDFGESLRSLPHKLRFKAPGGGSDGGDVPPSHDSKHSYPPLATVKPHVQQINTSRDSRGMNQPLWTREEQGTSGGAEQQYQCASPGHHSSSPPLSSSETRYMMENNNLISQLSSLSQDVAQLKKLFSQQVFSKLA